MDLFTSNNSNNNIATTTTTTTVTPTVTSFSNTCRTIAFDYVLQPFVSQLTLFAMKRFIFYTVMSILIEPLKTAKQC